MYNFDDNNSLTSFQKQITTSHSQNKCINVSGFFHKTCTDYHQQLQSCGSAVALQMILILCVMGLLVTLVGNLVVKIVEYEHTGEKRCLPLGIITAIKCSTKKYLK